MERIVLLMAVISFQVALANADTGIWRYNRCPRRCNCALRFSHRFQANMRTVDCGNKDLTAFPKAERIPSDTQILLLTDNRIARIDDTLRLWLPDLLQLDLSHNKIGRFRSRRGIFDGVYNLQYLNLAANRLTTLKQFAFQGLFNLQELNLSNNHLSAIMNDAFSGLAKLETLDLSNNYLTYIQNSWWHHIPTLYSLKLKHNRLRLVQQDAFRSLEHLMELDLSNNRLFRLNPKAFSGLQTLHNLHLNSNELNAIPQTALTQLRSSLTTVNFANNPIFRLSKNDFAKLTQLKEIRLSNMYRLRVVERETFKDLPSLVVLKLHDCPHLAYLDPYAFSAAQSLTHLHLHNNNLTVLETETLESLPDLRQVSFYGNPLSCDCNMRWLRKMLATDSVTRPEFKEAERMVCSSPMEHKFKLFVALSENAFPYRCPPRILDLFSDINTRREGDNILYDCRAVGVPRPQIGWVTPDGHPIQPTVYHSRHKLSNNGQSLLIKGVTLADNGLYTCIARSEEGAAAVQTYLNVTELDLELRVSETGATSAMLTWDGESSKTGVFQILYRAVGRTFHRHQYATTVTPLTRSYTLERLRPSTEYEACMAQENDEHIVSHLSCVRFVTGGKRTNSFFSQLTDAGNGVNLAAAAGVFIGLAAIICFVAVVLTRTQQTHSDDRCDVESGLSTKTQLLDDCYSNEMSSSIITRPPSTENLYSPLVILS